MPTPALAYVGPGPGLELIPYFFSLLTWVGLAVGATLFWPITSLVRRLWPSKPTQRTKEPRSAA
jgi:hypothetical protein